MLCVFMYDGVMYHVIMYDNEFKKRKIKFKPRIKWSPNVSWFIQSKHFHPENYISFFKTFGSLEYEGIFVLTGISH